MSIMRIPAPAAKPIDRAIGGNDSKAVFGVGIAVVEGELVPTALDVIGEIGIRVVSEFKVN